MDTALTVTRTLDTAREEGLLPAGEKDARVSGRIHRHLLDAAKQATGLTSETALLEYALAKVALEDEFGTRLARLRGSVDPDLDLEF